MSERPQDPNGVSDDAVDAAWRARSRDEPPPAMDDAIRAAARRAIASGPVGGTPSGQPRAAAPNWRPLAAVAAVAVIAFGLLRWMPQDEFKPVKPPRASEPGAPTAVKELPPSAGNAVLEAASRERDRSRADDASANVPSAELRAPPPPAPLPATPAQLDQAPRGQVPQERQLTSPDVAQESSPQTARQRSQAVAPPTHDEISESGKGIASKVTGSSAAVQSSAAQPAAAAAPASDQREPAAFVHEIEALYAAGLYERAADELRRFRTSYPDADRLLPEKLRPWAASVKD